MSKLQNLLAQRRFNQMELMQEHDPKAKEALAAHIAQLDADIARLQRIYKDPDEETTQVMPRITMNDLVYNPEQA